MRPAKPYAAGCRASGAVASVPNLVRERVGKRVCLEFRGNIRFGENDATAIVTVAMVSPWRVTLRFFIFYFFIKPLMKTRYLENLGLANDNLQPRRFPVLYVAYSN
uniref:Uncharacterized protein n=1 Tax=Rhizophora mucronata TaxID=61149 RepID=A0A2P2LE46_RHIMU